ncbi:MAG: carbohydrate-binding family 9-like protein [Chitinophagaceae bacterium]|nr:carbohydrate-binding family 9-like protein [Chitinophagaceae bacterium]
MGPTMFYKGFLLVLLCLPGRLAIAQQDIFNEYEHLFTLPRHYTAYQVKTGLNIDGKINEKAWRKAPWSEYYTDIEGSKQPAPALKTRCKMLWDEKHLYIAAELEEPHIWGKLTKHDQIIYQDNDFEVFIDPDNDTHHYFELEFNALNTVFDLYLSKPYRNRGHLRMDWNAKGLRSAVYTEGTTNNALDTDKKWTIEIAIPFDALTLEDYAAKKPADGDTWRINFSRVQWHTKVKDGDYVKKTNPETGKSLPENNWVWSPQGVINMHFPERWGYLQFSGRKAGKKPVPFVLPEGESFKKYLWLVYYKQKAYARQNRQYATGLPELKLPETVTEGGETATLELHSLSQKEFKAVITISQSGKRWQIDQDGKITGF